MIKRRTQRVKKILPQVLALVFLAFLVFKTPGCGKDKKDRQKELLRPRPNFILIVTDDQVLKGLQYMPCVRAQLLDRGIFFSNTFCASPVCAPSRASIFTGQYLHHHGVTTNAEPSFIKKRDQKDTLATVLRDNGYTTALIGKYTHGPILPHYIAPGWDVWYALLGGAPGYYHYQLNDNGRPLIFGGEAEDYSTDVLAREACAFIRTLDKSKRPFFLYLAPFAPHAPKTPAPRHRDAFAGLHIPLPQLEKDISDKPLWLRDNRRLNAKKELPNQKSLSNRFYAKRMETLLAVDDMISGMLKALSDSGKIDSTYIFMLADNGDDYSRHTGFSGKLLPYEEGIRTPLIVRAPGMRSAASCDQLVSAVDLLPTMAELAGAPKPSFADGRSLVPLLSNCLRPASAWRDACLVELGKFEKWYYRSHPPAYALLRFKNGKYIEYETGEKEYYDLRADPDELGNIYQNLDAALKSRLHEQLREALARAAGL